MDDRQLPGACGSGMHQRSLWKSGAGHPRRFSITNELQVEDDENVADRLADEAVLAMVKVPDTRRSGPGCRNREWASEDHRGRRYSAARSILWRYASWATHHQHLCRTQDRKR